MKAFIGLSAAIAAGAWLGLLAAFAALPSESGWDELQLSGPAARAVLSFMAAYAVCELLWRRFGARWYVVVPATCFFGSVLFGSIGYLQTVAGGRPTAPLVDLQVVPMLFTFWTVPVMAGVVVIGHGVVRFGSWLGRAASGVSSRAMIDR